VLLQGQLLTAAEIGLLATVGRSQVKVFRKVRVGVLSSGDELVEPGVVNLPAGKIRDSNRFMLMAAAVESGAVPVDLGGVADEPVSTIAIAMCPSISSIGSSYTPLACTLSLTGHGCSGRPQRRDHSRSQ